jgi:hypothetical protein
MPTSNSFQKTNIVTSNRKITSLTASHIQSSIDTAFASARHSGSVIRHFDDVANWPQVEHGAFINGIQEGTLLPVWANDTVSDLDCPFMFGHMWDGDVQYCIGGGADAISYESASAITNVNLAEFPIRSTRKHHSWRTNTWQPRNFQLVGGIPLPFQNVAVVHKTLSGGDKIQQIFMVQHPTNWNQFRTAIDNKFVGAGGDVERVYTTNRARYMDTIIRPTFEDAADKEGCVNAHFAMSQEKQGLWFAHLPDVDPAYDGSNTFYSRVRFPQSWAGTDASYRWSGNHMVNDYHATTYSAAYIWSQWNGVAADAATREFFDHFTRNMGHTYDAVYGHVNTAAAQQLTLSKLYSGTDDWSAMRNSALTRGEVNVDGVVVDSNGDPILAESESIVAPADPMLGLSTHNTTAVWRDIVVQMKDALEADN